MAGPPYPKLVLGAPVEVPDGAGEVLAIVAWLEAISLGERQMTEEKDNNQVSNDLPDNRCRTENKAGDKWLQARGESFLSFLSQILSAAVCRTGRLLMRWKKNTL